MLYDYTNRETEAVLKCFRAGNYNYLRDLPDVINSENVTDRRYRKQEDNLKAREKPKRYSDLVGGGYFAKFEYTPVEYNFYLDAQRKDRADDKLKQQIMHGERPWVPNDQKVKHKYENPFDERDKEYLFPFMRDGDPYETTMGEVLRTQWYAFCSLLTLCSLQDLGVLDCARSVSRGRSAEGAREREQRAAGPDRGGHKEDFAVRLERRELRDRHEPRRDDRGEV